jgi:hypothetical protein
MRELKRANRVWWTIWLGRLVNDARHDPLPEQPIQPSSRRKTLRLKSKYRKK